MLHNDNIAGEKEKKKLRCEYYDVAHNQRI